MGEKKMRETISDVRQERDYWRETAMKDWEPLLRSMTFGAEGFDVAVAGKAAEAVAASFISMFKAGGSANYMEMSFFDKSEPFQRYTVTVQKAGAKSPADLVNEAKARIAALETELSTLKDKG